MLNSRRDVLIVYEIFMCALNFFHFYNNRFQSIDDGFFVTISSEVAVDGNKDFINDSIT